ncbi:hypothetical protein BDN72DRAFT_150330 [Pluteus cervinus]|uniref:Uncharacterized protein n=1 Tax=Pluteus cervinus TaxID=181527 RepID=A0ACD3B722_9AGAR|nr:hypothetical protein BDN72DRAFT_150330 [Pluteus cervinus]
MGFRVRVSFVHILIHSFDGFLCSFTFFLGCCRTYMHYLFLVHRLYECPPPSNTRVAAFHYRHYPHLVLLRSYRLLFFLSHLVFSILQRTLNTFFMTKNGCYLQSSLSLTSISFPSTLRFVDYVLLRCPFFTFCFLFFGYQTSKEFF